MGLGEIPIRLLLGQEVEAPASPSDPSTLRVDDEHRLVFTPGFAAFTRFADVRAGIDAMVERVLALLESAA